MIPAASTPGTGIRVLLVDDSRVVRLLLERILADEPGIEVVGSASSGAQGLDLARERKPDVIVLDVEMPGMDGLAVVRAVRRDGSRTPIIMFSALTDRGAAVTLDALAAGATDYVLKPSAAPGAGNGEQQVRAELVTRIRLHGRPAPAPRSLTRATACPLPARAERCEVLAIGCSTGGPNALVELLGALKAPLPVPVLIVQHMPPIFTRLLAERIARGTPCPASEATSGEALVPGQVLVAPGGFHLRVENRRGAVQTVLGEDPPVHFCRPSVDPLFESVAEVYGSGVLALVLTGMGSDGLEGARRVKERGGAVLAQDEESSVVWGMPGAVVKAGVAACALPIPGLVRELVARSARKGAGKHA